MKHTTKLPLVVMALIALLTWTTSTAVAQAVRTNATVEMTASTYLEPPVVEHVGPLIHMTVHVLWTFDATDPRLNGPCEVAGVWVVDQRDGSATGHGVWTLRPESGGVIEGPWTVDGKGIMHAVGHADGGELDGALTTAVSTDGHPFEGHVTYSCSLLIPARK